VSHTEVFADEFNRNYRRIQGYRPGRGRCPGRTRLDGNRRGALGSAMFPAPGDCRQTLPWDLPVMHSESACAKTSEVQFDFLSQKSGHEGAVSNAVTTP
jgi:hypothetical protein